MSTLTAILEADVDGTLHLPLPVELRYGKVKVTAVLEPAEPPKSKAKAGLWKQMPGRFCMSADFDEPLEEESGVTPPQSELGLFAPPCG